MYGKVLGKLKSLTDASKVSFLLTLLMFVHNPLIDCF